MRNAVLRMAGIAEKRSGLPPFVSLQEPSCVWTALQDPLHESLTSLLLRRFSATLEALR